MNHMRFMTTVAATALIFGATAASAKNFNIAVGDGAGGTQEYLGKTFITELEKATDEEHITALTACMVVAVS